MSDRFCDRCGAKSSPRMPRTRIGDEMWCSMCAMNHRTAAAELHPDNVWQARTFGAHHTTGGRVLNRRTGASMDEQESRLGDQAGWLHHSSFRPVKFAIDGARAYASKVGLGDPHQHTYDHVRQNADTVRTVGRLYDALPEHDRSADSHFHAMGKEVGDQYHHLTHTMGINVQSVDHDPYRNVHEMVHDVENNKRLMVMGTHVTGGHPFFKDHENDQFRAVHDFFGHAATGRDFDRHGEQAAYLAHSQMFSQHARPALTSETKGQNTSLILNGHFGPQKIAILPKHHWDDSSLRGMDPQHAKLAGWSPEDVVRLETGRQQVHSVADGRELCAQHLHNAQSSANLATDLAAQTGLPRRYTDLSGTAPHEGRCTECARGQGANEGMPWNASPGGGWSPALRADKTMPRGWDERPMRRHVDSFGKPDTTIQSLNTRHEAKTPKLDKRLLSPRTNRSGEAYGAWSEMGKGSYQAAHPSGLSGASIERGDEGWHIRAYSMHPHCPDYKEDFNPDKMRFGGDSNTRGPDFAAEKAELHMRNIADHIEGEPHYPDQPCSRNNMRNMSRRIAVVIKTPHERGPIRKGAIVVLAHDSGDGETIFHCPFCGSGQVLARSDGAVDCEFCQTAFTVQVQPQMPSFPQTIDGVPVDVPGMPNGGQSANVPPGGAPGDPMDPNADPDAAGDDSGNPFADGGGDSGDDSDDDSGGGSAPPFGKKSTLDETHYMQHLALHFLDRERVLPIVQHENGVAW